MRALETEEALSSARLSLEGEEYKILSLLFGNNRYWSIVDQYGQIFRLISFLFYSFSLSFAQVDCGGASGMGYWMWLPRAWSLH